MAYRDNGNSNYGTAQILTINGTTITAGTETVFNSGNTYYISATALSDSKVLMAYQDDGNSNYGTVQVLAVPSLSTTRPVGIVSSVGSNPSGISASGSETVFNSALTDKIVAMALSDSKVLVTYLDNGNSDRGTAVVLSISGNTITAGSEFVFNSGPTYYASAVALSDSKALVAYIDDGNSSYGIAIVLTVDGTTITAGSKFVFNSTYAYTYIMVALSSSKVLVAYMDTGNSSYGTAVVLTISGTTITAGTKLVFNGAGTDAISAVPLSDSKVLVAYQDSGNSSRGTARILTISGTTITAGGETVFNGTYTAYISSVALSDSKVLLAYAVVISTSYYETAQILTITGTTITASGIETYFDTGNADSTFISAVALSDSKVLVAHLDLGSATDYGLATILTISGTTITVGEAGVFNGGRTYCNSSVRLSESKVLVAYRDVANSNYGTAIVLSLVNNTAQVYPFASTRKITGLTGLSTGYLFVGPNGNLVAGDYPKRPPKVVNKIFDPTYLLAGRADSATELNVMNLEFGGS